MSISFELFKEAVDTMGASFVLLEPKRNYAGKINDFVVSYMNDEARKSTSAAIEAVGGNLLKVTELQKQSALFELFAQTVETGQPGSVHSRLNLVGGGLSDEMYDVICTPCAFGLAVIWRKTIKPMKKSQYTAAELFENWENSFSVFEVVTRADGTEDLRVLAANRTFASLISHDYETLTGKLFTEICAASMDWLPFYLKTAKTGVGSTHESFNYDLKKYLSTIEFTPAIGQVALIVEDRTHIWRNEQELRGREADLAMLFSSMASGFCVGKLVRNDQGEVVDALLEMVNPAYELLEGFPTATVQGKYLSELWSDEQDLARYKEVVAAQSKVVYTKYIPLTGATVEVVCFSHGHDLFVCVENNVSARVKAEQELAKSQAELAENHRIIMSSMDYASKIQRNLLPQTDVFKKAFSDHAIIWNPRDIVGGDIYWLKNFQAGSVLCVCDCTGHGAPGAFLTMLVVSAFESIINENNWMDTANCIWQLEQRLVHVLNVNAEEPCPEELFSCDIKDGCDLAVLAIDKDGGVTLSAGNTHVFVCDGTAVTQIKGQKIFIGEGNLKNREELKIVTIPPHPNQKFYIASDGFFDQIGQMTHRPFGYRAFKQAILENHDEKLDVVLKKLWEDFERHRGTERRRDDVQMIAFQK